MNVEDEPLIFGVHYVFYIMWMKNLLVSVIDCCISWFTHVAVTQVRIPRRRNSVQSVALR